MPTNPASLSAWNAGRYVSEHRPFTDEDGRKLADIHAALHKCDTTLIAAALNCAFPEGLAVPKPAMRTTPVTPKECDALVNCDISFEDWFSNIERIVGGVVSGFDFSIILSRRNHELKKVSYYGRIYERETWSAVINETLGLREPETADEKWARIRREGPNAEEIASMVEVYNVHNSREGEVSDMKFAFCKVLGIGEAGA